MRIRLLLVIGTLAICALPARTASAAGQSWTGEKNVRWTNNGNWVSHSPKSYDFAKFDGTFVNQPSINFPRTTSSGNSKNFPLQQIRVIDPGAPVALSIASGYALWLDSLAGIGIRMNLAKQDLTISGPGQFRQRDNPDDDVEWRITGNNPDGGDLTIAADTDFRLHDTLNLTINVGPLRTVNIRADMKTQNGDSAEIIKTGDGRLILGGNNLYQGDTTVSGGILELATDDAIHDLSDLIFAEGATLETGGFDDTFGTLAITGAGGAATFDFGNHGASNLALADSSAVAWSGGLDIVNFGGDDSIRFGASAAGLTSAQLDVVTINGMPAYMDEDGFLVGQFGDLNGDGNIDDEDLNLLLSALGTTYDAVDLGRLLENFGLTGLNHEPVGPLAAVPEPSSVTLLILGAVGAAAVRRRRRGRF